MRPSLNAFTFDIPPTLFLSLDAISKNLYPFRFALIGTSQQRLKLCILNLNFHTFLLLTLHNEIKSQLYSVKIK